MRNYGIGANRGVLVVFVLLLTTVLAKSKWRTVWRDDFNGGAGKLPKAKNWIFDIGTSYEGGPPNWGTGEIQTYTNSTDNVRLDGKGNLLITPLKNENGGWTSARIETQREDFKPPNGGRLAIEARIQLPNVTGDSAIGYWPAFWSMGAPQRQDRWSWPAIGEYDVMENVNGLNRAWGVLHCGVSPGGPCNEKNGLGNSTACPGSTCQSSFHIYRFEWDERQKEFRWYVDGMQYHQVSSEQIGDDTWNQLTNHGYFILLNVAMGGEFPDGVAGKATPVSTTVPGVPMVVDYVAVYARNCEHALTRTTTALKWIEPGSRT